MIDIHRCSNSCNLFNIIFNLRSFTFSETEIKKYFMWSVENALCSNHKICSKSKISHKYDNVAVGEWSKRMRSTTEKCPNECEGRFYYCIIYLFSRYDCVVKKWEDSRASCNLWILSMGNFIWKIFCFFLVKWRMIFKQGLDSENFHWCK